MREIPLTQNKVALVDDADYDELIKYKWFAARNRTLFYASRRVRKDDGTWTTQAMHIFIMGRIYIDHKNGNGLDNRRENLRLVTPQQNRQNTRRRMSGYSSKYKGVYFNQREQKYRASIYVNYKSKHLGYFYNEVDAAKAYDKAATELFGEYAFLNFPNGE